jgi:O-antigen/teichoic acid export membrane protein
VFWFATARIVGAEALGVASSISSLVIIISTITVLDMSLGMKRSLGIAISAKNLGTFKQILTSTILFVSILVALSAFLVVVPNLKILEITGIDRQYLWIIVAMIITQPFLFILSETLIVASRSKDFLMPFLIASLIRFPILFGTFYIFKLPILGTIIAYSSTIFVTAACFAFYSIKIFRGSHASATENMSSNIKLVAKAGLSSWIPHTMNTLGAQLGILTVFSSGGASKGGEFYIAMGIFTVTLFILQAITKVMHSSVASMAKEVQQICFLSYYMKLAFISTIPITIPLLFFSYSFLGLMGKQFSSASGALSILIANIPMVIISEMIYYFEYGKGNQKAVLYLGLAGNIPRIILYFILSPLIGVNGAAFSYVVGSIVQLVLSVRLGNKQNLTIEYKKYAILTAIPFAIGSVLWVSNIHFLISSVVIILGSYVAYARIHMLSEREVRDIMYGALPKRISSNIFPIVSKIIRRISD